MWQDKQFWADATWRSARTFLQTISGLLVVSQVSSAFSAPWKDLVGAGLVAAFISLAQSVDRGRAVVAVDPVDTEPETPADDVPAPVEAFVTPISCGDQLK